MRKTFLLAIALTSSAAFAAPCTTQVPLLTPRISLQRTASGSFRLHYEDSFLGYGPGFGLPVVSVFSNSITVTQPVFDGDPPGLPAPPTRLGG